VAKQFGFWITKNYRESYGIFATNGIMFNHESPRRGEDFVTRKITKGIKDILDGKEQHISIGNLEARRDWGHAKDYVEAMWRILQADEPQDWVVSTGVAHSVRDFIIAAFGYLGITLRWRGEGLDEVGFDADTGDVRVRINPAFFRPAEVDLLVGDSTQIRTKLGWNPEYTFEALVEDMMAAAVA
jgi:GDPmannose 4,6-dehydratase